jgi:hypothetical protein
MCTILFVSKVSSISDSFIVGNFESFSLERLPLRKAKRTIAAEIPQERGIVTKSAVLPGAAFAPTLFISLQDF